MLILKKAVLHAPFYLLIYKQSMTKQKFLFQPHGPSQNSFRLTKWFNKCKISYAIWNLNKWKVSALALVHQLPFFIQNIFVRAKRLNRTNSLAEIKYES